MRWIAGFVLVTVLAACADGMAQTATGGGAAGQGTKPARVKVFLDTDIGDDVDDAFALALLLSSPEFEVVGISGAWGDTTLRARMIERFLTETGHSGISVGAGVKIDRPSQFTQQQWAAGSKAHGPFPDGVTMLQQGIQQYPGQLTLIALGPLTNVKALIERDPATFRKLKQVVMMGGSVYKGYGDKGPEAEYNIAMSPDGAQKLLAAGVPLRIMPLDSTIVRMSEERRATLYAQRTPTAAILKELDREWAGGQERKSPTLFDVVPVATLVDASICPTTPMRLEVDDKGFTRPVAGKPNVAVCLKLNEARFFKLYYGRLISIP